MQQNVVPVQPDAQASPSTADQPDAVTKKAYFGRFKMEWDTTVKYNSMFRLAKESVAIVGTTVPNNNNSTLDDGDNNFHRGLVSNRTDILSEMDISFGSNFGIRASMAAWGNPVYNQRTGNTSPVTWNARSSDYHHFAAGTKDLDYLYAELLDAFMHARIPIGKTTLAVRGGQFAQQWGQSVFFGSNGIAGAMAPIDLIKLLSVPNAQFKEIIRPVPQVAAVLQVNPKLSIGAYYQLRFVETRFPSVGSYMSNSDVLGAGAETFFLSPGGYYGPWLHRTADTAAKNWGQFGVEVLVRAPHGWDLGFYGLQFHDTAPQIYLYIDDPAYNNSHAPPGPTNPLGSYRLVYPENIKSIAISASKTTGITNWAAEISGRLNQDLAVAATAYVPSVPFVPDNNKRTLYPSGDTLHGNISALATLHPNFIARDSMLLAEVAWNDLLSISKNESAWTTENNATKQAIAFMALYTPTYHQIRSGLDLNVPIGINFSPYGRSVLGPGFATEKGGFFNIGGGLAYHDANRFSITYQRFLGDQGGSVFNNNFSYKQSYGDRNYVVLSLYRTFGVQASEKIR